MLRFAIIACVVLWSSFAEAMTWDFDDGTTQGWAAKTGNGWGGTFEFNLFDGDGQVDLLTPLEHNRLSPVYWGQGFASEAVRNILQVGFEDLELDEIEARCVVANRRSVRLLHRLGFEEAERIPPGPGRGAFKDRMLPEWYVFLLSRDKWIEHPHVFY